MASFELSGPDGGTYRVEASDEASARAALQSALGAPAAPVSSAGVDAAGSSGLGHTAWGLGASAAAGLGEGLIGLAGLPGDLVHLGRHALGYSTAPEAAYGSNWMQRQVENYTGEFHKPQGAAEEIVNRIGQFAPALIGGPETLAARLGTRVLAPALASEAAAKATEGTAYQPYAEGLAAILGGRLGSDLRMGYATLRAGNKVPSAVKLIDSGGQQLGEASRLQANLTPSAADRIASGVKSTLADAYITPDMQPMVFNRLDRLAQPAMAGNDFERVRQELGHFSQQGDMVARKASEALTDRLGGLSSADAVGPDAARYVELMQQAAANSAAGRRANMAMGRAAFDGFEPVAGTAPAEARQAALARLLEPGTRPGMTTMAQQLGFTEPEIDALKTAHQGTLIGNATQRIDKWASAPLAAMGLGALAGGKLPLPEGMTGMLAGLAGAGLGSGALELAKHIGKLPNDNAVRAMDSLIRARSPLAGPVAAQLPGLFAQLHPATQALMIGGLAADKMARGPQPRPPQIPRGGKWI